MESPEQDELERFEAHRITVEENELEKKIQPVGFVPSNAVEDAVAAAVRNGTLDGSLLTAEKLAQNAEAIEEIHAWLQFNRPLRYFIPNVGQEKALLPLKTIDPNDREVIIGMFCGANMVGKTTAMAAPFLGGCIWGKSEMNEFFDDWTVFDKFEMVRRTERRPLRVRIICHAGGMEDGGQVMEEITKWWPRGLYKWEKNHKAYYSVCKCWSYSGELLAIVNVRTHDQPRSAHAGHTLDIIAADEPIPEHLWTENVARLRQNMGGVLWGFLSPLDDAGWIQDRLASDSSVHFTNACIWDNCDEWHPDPAMWSGKKVGVGHVLTRGKKAAKIIRKMIAEWEKEGPEIADARANGAFTHLAGSVLKDFGAAHIIAPFVPPPNWPCYMGLDPHDGKPHLAGWFFQDEGGNVYLCAEYPPEQWDRCKGSISVGKACADWRVIEEPFREQVICRVGDPKRLRSTKSNVREVTNFQNEFAGEGFMFELGINDISVGLSRIREALAFDPRVPGSRPHYFVMSHNPWTGAPNHTFTNGPRQFSYKKLAGDASNSRDPEAIFEEKWKDPVDVMRYVLMRMGPYVPVTRMRKALNSFRQRRVNRSARPWNC